MPPLKVYTVAEFEATRIGLGSIIEAAPDMENAGQAPTFEAMSASREFQQADVLLADVKALNRAALDELRARFPGWADSARILFFGSEQAARSMKPEDLSVCLALSTVGFLLVDTPAGRLVGALRLVGQGKFVCECEMEALRSFCECLRDVGRRGVARGCLSALGR
jgi:hypothetical protein